MTLSRKELDFYYELFTNNLEYDANIKERKLYDYSIYLRFYNTKRNNYHIFKVFFDRKKESYRPVFLRLKKEDHGGYSFALNDEELKFYQKIMEIWKTSEKSTI